MKYIFVLVFLLSSLLSGSVLRSTIVSVDSQNKTANIKIDKIDVGMSGFVVHNLSKEHTSILKNVVVESFDEQNGIATLKLSDFEGLQNDALPRGKWSVQVGDTVELAFGYSRALLISPTVEIYSKITKSTRSIEWIHPDIFVSILSSQGHPTPLKDDFEKMRNSMSVGLLFFYIKGNLFTVDAKSFKILNVSEVSLEQKDVRLPFYSRIEEIDAAWFGEGSEEMENYDDYYSLLLLKYNLQNKKLQSLVEDIK